MPASSKLEIIVNAKDNASGTIGRLGGALDGLGNIATRVATIGLAAVAGGVAALGAGIVSSIGAAMEAQDNLAELNAVIESTGGIAGVTAEKAQALASSFQDVTRFSDDAILKGENMLLTFTKIGSDVFPMATEAMLNMAQKFGSIEAASVQLGKALNDPVDGVTALRRVGVMLTATQEETIQKMVAMGDIAGAQKVILAELETEFGGLAIAAGTTAAGKFDILKNKIGDVQEVIGGAFLPVLTLAAEKLAEGIDSAQFQAGLDTITGGLTEVINFVKIIAEGGIEAALQRLKTQLDLSDLPKGVGDAIFGDIARTVADAERIGTAFGKMFGAENLTGVDAVVAAFDNIAGAVTIIANSVEAVERVFNAVKGSVAGQVAGAIGSAIQITPSEVATNFNTAQTALSPEGFQAAPQGGFGGQFGGQIDLTALGQIIISALQAAPPPVVNVSTTLNGKEIAQDVSATLGAQALTLSRQGGFNAR